MKHLFKTLLLSLLLVAGASSSYIRAEHLTPEEALRRVESSSPRRVIGTQPASRLSLAFTQRERTSDLAMVYVFNHADGKEGFLVLAADDVVGDIILAHSDDTTFDPGNIPPAMQWLLAAYSEYVAHAASAPKTLFLNAAPKKAARAARQDIAPLVPTHWNQYAPYYNNCPQVSDGRRCLTGCVATAMAQVMKYHEWPTTGTGSYTHTFTFDGTEYTTSANFGATTYDWANMTNTYSNKSSAAENAAVATLMHHCGVASKMNYTPGSSGTSDLFAGVALVKYFNYDRSMRNLMRDWFDEDEWDELMYNQLASSLPVLYGGNTENFEGHEFVCDGYQASDGKYHINWGWGGSSDGYFMLNNLTPSSMGAGGADSGLGFNMYQSIICDIKRNVGSPLAVTMYLGDDLKTDKSVYAKEDGVSITLMGGVFSMSLDDVTITPGLQIINGTTTQVIPMSSMTIPPNYGFGGVSLKAKDLNIGENDITYVYSTDGGTTWQRPYYKKALGDGIVHLSVTSDTVTSLDSEEEPSTIEADFVSVTPADANDGGSFFTGHDYDFTYFVKTNDKWEGDLICILVDGNSNIVTNSATQKQTIDGCVNLAFRVTMPSTPGTYNYALGTVDGNKVELCSEFGSLTVIEPTTLDDLPFKVSRLNADGTFSDDMHWYQIVVNRDPNGTGNNAIKYATCNATDGKIENQSTYTPSVNTLLAFTGNMTSGFRIYSYAVGSGKVLWGTGESVPFTPVTNVEPGTDWILEYVSTSSNYDGKRDGWTFRRNGTAMTYLHDLNSVMGTWDNSSAKNDAGSHFLFVEVTGDELAALQMLDVYSQVNADGYVGNYSLGGHIDALTTALAAKNHQAITAKLAEIGGPNKFSNGKLYCIKNQGTTSGTDGGYLEGHDGHPCTTTKTGHTFDSDLASYQWMVYNDGTGSILYSVMEKGALSSTSSGTGNSAAANWELQTTPARHANVYLTFTPDTDHPHIFSVSDPQQPGDYAYLHENSNFNTYTYGLTNWSSYSSSAKGSGWTFQEIGDASDAVMGELAECIDHNLPRRGTFIRLKGSDSDRYVAMNGIPSSPGQNAPMVETEDNSTVFYYDTDGHLLNYVSGTYLCDVNRMGQVGTAGDTYTFSAELTEEGMLACIAQYDGNDCYLADCGTCADRQTTFDNKQTSWRYETVNSLALTISSAGAATLHLPVTCRLPEGLTAYYASSLGGDDNSLLYLEPVAKETDGTTQLAANEPVLVRGMAGEIYTVTLSANDADKISSNIFDGTLEAILHPASLDDNMVLAIDKNTSKLAFCRTTSSYISPFRAYLSAETLNGLIPYAGNGLRSLAISWNDVATAIAEAEARESGHEVYDLSGRRVTEASSGLYIINGKKTVIRR